MIENVADEINEVLALHLPGELNSAGLTKIDDFFIAERDQADTRLPAVYTLAATTDEQAWLNAQHDELHNVSVLVVHKHLDTQKLARELFKYTRIVRRILKTRLPQTPVKFIYAVTVLRHNYGPTTAPNEGEGGAYTRHSELQIRAAERIKEV